MRGDASAVTCEVCGTRRATHLCEDCGAVLCPECLEAVTREYWVCRECHTDLGTPLPGESTTQCTNCGSKDLARGRRTTDRCPKCHSVRTVLIDVTRRNLAAEMKRAVMGIRYGHMRLREFRNRLEEAKQLLVSLRMADFLHYNWLEAKVEGLHAELPAVKRRIANQAEIVARQMVAETRGLIDYTRWAPEQFSFVRGVVHRLVQLSNDYRERVDEALQGLMLTVADLKAQLDGVAFYRKQFRPFRDYTEFRVNEHPVCAFPDIALAGSDFLKNDKARGTLFITDVRMVFIAETGRMRKRTDVVFDFPLSYLSNIEPDTKRQDRLVFKMRQGDLRFSCNPQTKSVLPQYVEVARTFNRHMQTDMQRVRRLQQTDTSVSDVRLKIESLIHMVLSSRTQGHDTSATVRPSQSMRGPAATGWYPAPTARAAPQWYSHAVTPQHDHGTSSYWAIPHSTTDIPAPSPVQTGQPHQTAPNVQRPPSAGTPTTGHPGLGRPPTSSSTYSDSYQPQQVAGLQRLKQQAAVIDEEIRRTVRMMRDGRLAPEDFIRRYRELVRDAYMTSIEIERLTAGQGYPVW